MAQQTPEIYESKVGATNEFHDGGVLDFLEKKEEENKPQDELSVPDFAKDHVLKAEEMKEEAEAEAAEENNPETIVVKELDHSNNIPSDERHEPSLVEKIKETVTVDKTEDQEVEAAVEPEEKKSFIEKIKAKLPGANKEDKSEEETTPLSFPAPTKTIVPEEETEKKGFMEKIMDKLPGQHKEGDDKVV